MFSQVFDRLLLLRKGGQTVYFGDIGSNAGSVIKYFEAGGGRRIQPGENPCALFVLSLLSSLNLLQSRVHA